MNYRDNIINITATIKIKNNIKKVADTYKNANKNSRDIRI